jgi:hypothetical protein
MNSTIIIGALVLLIAVALLKKFIKFALLLAVLGALYWFFLR